MLLMLTENITKLCMCSPVFNLSVRLKEKLDLVGCGRFDMVANIVNQIFKVEILIILDDHVV
jgi:hypothetical protein